MLSQSNFLRFFLISWKFLILINLLNLVSYEVIKFLFFISNSDMHFFEMRNQGRINSFQRNILHVGSNSIGINGITKHTFKSSNLLRLIPVLFLNQLYVIIRLWFLNDVKLWSAHSLKCTSATHRSNFWRQNFVMGLIWPKWVQFEEFGFDIRIAMSVIQIVSKMTAWCRHHSSQVLSTHILARERHFGWS